LFEGAAGVLDETALEAQDDRIALRDELTGSEQVMVSSIVN
jgi:hypothetical protein